MTMEFKVRTWLWVTLAVIVTAGLGFTTWYISGSREAKITTSPTPTKSVAVSPSAGTTTTPTSGKTSTPDSQTATPTQTPTSTVETSTWQGILASGAKENLSCVPRISFQYPKPYNIAQPTTPTQGGGSYLMLDGAADNDQIDINTPSYTQDAQYQPIYCVDPQYENLTDYANRKGIGNYSSKTVNGLLAIQYSEGERTATAIQNSDKKIVLISVSSNAQIAADIIINSLSFN